MGTVFTQGATQGESADLDTRVVMGRVRGAHGVRGLVRVQPFSEQRDTLLLFKTWMLGVGGEWCEVSLISGNAHGGELLVKLAGVEDRDHAQRLRGREIAIWRMQLPVLAQDEYYWSDLEGLSVWTCEGVNLGVVERVFATGANDVLVVKGEQERLIPFLLGDVVLQVDLQTACIKVDWDPDF